MDYHKRQAAGASGRVPRDFDDYYDLARLLVFLLLSSFAVVVSLWDASQVGILFHLGGFAIFATALWAVIVCFQSGRLEVVSEEFNSLRHIRGALEELGYEANSGDDYYTRFTRKTWRFGPSVCVEIFTFEEKLLGHAWVSFHRWKRMPFVTGRSQISTIREKLLASHLVIQTNSGQGREKRSMGSIDGDGVTAPRRPVWRKRK